MDTNKGLRVDIGADIDEVVKDTEVVGKEFGKFLMGPEIGRGGMGVVHWATDTSVGRPVVIKLVSFPSRRPQDVAMMIARFQREAQAACRVESHPNVVAVYEFTEIDGRHMLVMERIEGRTLHDELTADGRPRAMAMRKAVGIVIEILKGLEAIHAANIVHRDLKPGNIMLTHKDDQVKILDFGLGKAIEPSGDPAFEMTLTQCGGPIGSPPYMSPEQTRSLPVLASTDIYSVGAMLFRMLTGRAPFTGKSPSEIYEKHQLAPVPMIVVPGGAPVPQGLEAVVRKAMAKAPGDRYGSASEMRAALEVVDFGPKPKIAVVKPKPKPKSGAGSLPVAVVATLTLLVLFVLTSPVTLFAAAAAIVVNSCGPETVIVADQGNSDGSVKAVEAEKALVGISIPPPPPLAMATVAQGCESYTNGRTTDAIATLTRALEKSPADTDGLYCLCGAYVRQPESRAEARKTCKAYLSRPDKDADKTRQVNLWVRRLN